MVSLLPERALRLGGGSPISQMEELACVVVVEVTRVQVSVEVPGTDYRWSPLLAHPRSVFFKDSTVIIVMVSF